MLSFVFIILCDHAYMCFLLIIVTCCTLLPLFTLFTVVSLSLFTFCFNMFTLFVFLHVLPFYMCLPFCVFSIILPFALILLHLFPFILYYIYIYIYILSIYRIQKYCF